MELQEFLESMKSSCNFLETEGYSLRKVDTSINRNFWYEKHTEIEGFRISFGWKQYGDEFHVKGLQVLKRFNEIENIFREVKGGVLSDFYTIQKSPIIENIPSELNYTETENNIHFVIKNQNEIILFSNFVEKFFNTTVKSFFDFFNDLTSVNFWLNDNEVEQHKNLIVSWDNTMMIRKLLIMKIIKNDNYSNLFDRYKTFLTQKNNEQESPYVSMFSFFNKVEAYLF